MSGHGNLDPPSPRAVTAELPRPFAGRGSATCTGKKTPGTGKKTSGEPGHTRDTRDTRAHKGTRTTQTNLTVPVKHR